MKKRVLAVLMSGALVFSTVPAVFATETQTEAEETGGEGGILDMMGSLVSEGEELGGLDFTDEEEDVVDAEAEEEIRAFIMEQNAEFIEDGDYNFVTPLYVTQELLEDGSLRVLGEFMQENFKQEDTDLKLAGGVYQPWLLTLEMDENNTWTVADAKTTEDGEGFSDSLAALCEEAGITLDEYTDFTSNKELTSLAAYIQFLKGTDGIERIEYAGEMLTADDLEKKAEVMVQEVFSKMFEDLMLDMTEEETE